MELVVLGSGTGAVSTRRASPSLLLRLGGTTCLVDTGPGSLRQLVAAGGSLGELEHLFYTHAHLDHVNDLWALLFAANIPWLERPARLHLHGSPAFLEFFERVSEAIGPWVAARRRELVVEAVRDEDRPLGRARVRGRPVPHIDSSLAYRFEEGERALVVSGDTDLGDEIIQIAQGADLLVLECSTPDGHKVDGHLTPSLCGQVAARAGVARLLLTHLYPSLEGVDVLAAVRRHYSGEASVAEDLERISI